MLLINKKHFLGFIVSSILISTSFFVAAQCPKIIWEDNFDGTQLDFSKWSFQNGDGCDLGPNLCGWGNNELQWYQPNNAVLEDGKLKIIAKREQVQNSNYTSSKIRSINKGDWTYGRFEASIKLPTGQGIWPAFWMLPTNDVYGGWPQSGEIDIVELVGHQPEIAHGTIHYGSPWPNNSASGNSYRLESSIFNDEFHEFAVEWEANEIRWFVDDFLYSTKTRSDVSPSRWPFDKDFYFLLNMAVGGNWPGSPNASTVFPQTMEVDYVRVYDKFLPYITGSRKVPNQAKNIQYRISNASATANITWTVPEGATIISGQGTTILTVDWDNSGGSIQSTITDDCRTETINLEVVVGSAVVKESSFEAFDETGRINLGFFSGTFEDEVTNPAPNEVNASNLVGKYIRDGATQYDVVVYSISDLENTSVYLEGEKKFFIDVYTSAPIGTNILLQLENSNMAVPSNFPRGRHSRFEVVTTVQNEWERLEFQLIDQPDPSVPDGSIDQFIFLFAPNTFTDATYYFDNFDTYSPSSTVSTKELLRREHSLVNVTPNPMSRTTTLHNISEELVNYLQIIDLNGRVIQEESLSLFPNQRKEINIKSLTNGVYILKALSEKGYQQNQQILVIQE